METQTYKNIQTTNLNKSILINRKKTQRPTYASTNTHIFIKRHINTHTNAHIHTLIQKYHQHTIPSINHTYKHLSVYI